MTEMFCDILPADNGWIFVSGGHQSPSYPSYELAVRAASEHSEKTKTPDKRVVIRQQTLRGDMTDVAMPAAAPVSDMRSSNAV